MIWLVRYWKPVAALVLAALLWGWGYYTARVAGLYALQVERTKAERVIADYAKAEAEAQARARTAEQAIAAEVAAVAAQYERDKANAEASANRTIADLRSGTIRLRREWQGCETDRVSGGAEAARIADEAAQLRREAIARVLGAGAEADAQVRALQEYARAVSR